MTCFFNRYPCHCRQNDVSRFFLKGDTGPAGECGKGLQIDGTVSSVEELPSSPVNGTAYFVGNDDNKDLFIFDENTKTWQNEGPLRGEKGEKGEKGAPSKNIMDATYLVTLRDPSFPISDDGLEIRSGERLPIKNIHGRSTQNGAVTLNDGENTIKFIESGAYEIIVTFNGFVKFSNQTFNRKTDFVCVGFREIGSDNV